MGEALMQRWLAANLLNRSDIIDPSGVPDSLLHHNEVVHIKSIEEAELIEANIVILCVKPQIMDIVCAGIKNYLPKGVPVLSIAAGKDVKYFEAQFAPSTPIIRVMPNLPATIGKGISALYANDAVTPMQKEMAQALFDAAGQTLWLEDESLMDAVTALSGSGPAYVFHLIEVMASAGEKLGLPQDQALMLARQTVIGAAALTEDQPQTSPATLRQNVTSKGGTTEAALEVLMDGRWQKIMDKALTAARDRGRDLAK